ncbi:MAG: RagB/SusD family nutrient uptake outer membrane protein, partial [Flavitalea sp.]
TTLVQLGNTSTTGGFGDLVPNNLLLGNLGITTTGFPDLQRGPDVRAQLYEWGTAGRGTRFIETTKFFGKSGFPNLDNVPVIRVPELYLIRAEARLKKATPDEAGALADVNRIRTNRGLAESAATGADLLEETLLQKMLEYAFEGHRWFDLKRLGRDIVKPTTIPFTDTRILPAIPQREVDGNSNMRQNPGY